MPYDTKLDKSLFSRSAELDSMKLTVSVFSYNDGPGKMQISRQRLDGDKEWQFAKLGRMTKKEVKNIMPLMEKALKYFPKKEKSNEKESSEESKD